MSSNESAYLRPPLVVIATGEEWLSLSVETLFSPRGYAVLRSFSAVQVIQRMRDTPPDLVVVSKDLRDMGGIDLCRLLRQDPLISRMIPIMLIASRPWEREERLEALHAGAWDACSLPMDGEELFLRVDAWVRAKMEADGVREHGLLDASTGMYNAQGLLRRIMEIAAAAERHRRPLACVVIGLDLDGTTDLSAPGQAKATDAATRFAARLQSAGRASDTIGRLNETEFVVVAPDTDSEGAMGLARRLKQAVEAESSDPTGNLRMRFGCYAVPDFRDASIAPAEMLIRAAEALHGASPTGTPAAFFRRSLENLN